MDKQTLKDKIPPNNDDAEKALLGSVLQNPDKINDIVNNIDEDDFYHPAHQKIFRAMKDMAASGASSRIDIISMTEQLKTKGELEACGGVAYIAKLSDLVPTAANIEYYATIVRDCSFRRSVLDAASVMAKNAHDSMMDANTVVETAEQELFKLTQKQKTNEIYNIRSVVIPAVHKINELVRRKGYSGICSGFSKLDELTHGFQNSDYIIIGARPSIGKTALALTMANNMAVRFKVPVGFFSLEMSHEQLALRLICQEAKIDSQKLRAGILAPSDFAKIRSAGDRLCDSALYIDDTPNISLLTLRANARRMVKEYGVKIIFIDYIGLITSDRNSVLPRHEQVAEYSRSLKALARELLIPIIVLAQVGRQSEGEQPKLSDLRDSGSIEQDADIVMFLHRDRGLNQNEYSAKKGMQNRDGENASSASKENESETKLIIAKHRNGPTDVVKLNFVSRYALFTEIAKQKED